ncbi:hypothetical protein [Modestobacter sp. I12A-02662]|uniref:hypothetical protein n=1 Tax=Modestobacter sp. I12A-02662 TaxID=1730496 RepID=UPI0034DF5754
MITTAAVLGCVVLAGLAVFQGLLVAGAPLGRFAWGGGHRVLPNRLRMGSAASIVLYALFAVVLVAAARRSTGPADVAIWVLTGYFVLGIGMNAISRSRPERLVMTPVVALLAGCCLVVALG